MEGHAGAARLNPTALPTARPKQSKTRVTDDRQYGGRHCPWLSIPLIYSAFRLPLDLSAVSASPVPAIAAHAHGARPRCVVPPGGIVDTDRTYSHILAFVGRKGSVP
jgi:hypothetical protein